MKKSIILFFALAALTQPAGAMSNEQVYKMCKPYVDSGFDTGAKYQDMCFGFFVGIAHSTHMLCEHAKYLVNKQKSTLTIDAETRGKITALSGFAIVHGSGGYNDGSYPVSAHVLSFTNWIEKNPSELSGAPMPLTWLQDYKCDIP